MRFSIAAVADKLINYVWWLAPKATPNKFPVSRPGNGLLMQVGGRLLLLICCRNFSEVEHPHNLQYTFLQA